MNVKNHRAERGYSLIEVVAVLGIIMVLATVAIYTVRQYLLHAKTAEAHEIIGSIMAGEEAYYEEAFRYLDVTGADFYPGDLTQKGDTKIQWGAANSSGAGCTGCGTNFYTLGVRVNQAVLFRYNVQTGDAGDDPADLLSGATGLTVTGTPFAAVSTAPKAHYVAIAASDLDLDGSDFSVVVGSSLQSDIYAENLGQ